MRRSSAKAHRRASRHSVRLVCQVVRERDFQLVADQIVSLSATGLLVSPADPALTGERLIVSFQIPHSGYWVDAEAVVARVVHGRRPGEYTRALALEAWKMSRRYPKCCWGVPSDAARLFRPVTAPAAARWFRWRRCSAERRAGDSYPHGFANISFNGGAWQRSRRNTSSTPLVSSKKWVQLSAAIARMLVMALPTDTRSAAWRRCSRRVSVRRAACSPARRWRSSKPTSCGILQVSDIAQLRDEYFGPRRRQALEHVASEGERQARFERALELLLQIATEYRRLSRWLRGGMLHRA